ncbi:MAG: hypothetical protein LBE25_13415 [Arthrobacter sp.]|jgi:hypothetical protein|nr:hypothetical protein [Arthrobacter sp.]
MAEWVAAGRWRPLLELIDQLPLASRYYEAFHEDPEVAEQIAREPLPERAWSPSLKDWDLQAQLLHDLTGMVRVLVSAVQTQSAGKVIRPAKGFPAPVTAAEKFRGRLEEEHARGLVQGFGFDPGDL